MSNPVSLINTARRGNRLINKTIPFVNPDATDAELGEFLGAYNDLSNDTFVSATKVARSSITVPGTADDPDPDDPDPDDPDPDDDSILTFDIDEVSYQEILDAQETGGVVITADYPGNGTITADDDDYYVAVQISGETITLTARDPREIVAHDQEDSLIVVRLSADGEYPAATATITITFEGSGGGAIPMPE